MRGAWIEMLHHVKRVVEIQSLPVRGAWIEIVHYFSGAGTTTVAPRAGSVD